MSDENRALRLQYLTLGWNLVEAVAALLAAGSAASIALLGFGLDSVVESISAGVAIWRLLAGRDAGDRERLEQIEHRARRLIAASLFALAAVIVFEGGRALWLHERPDRSALGIVVLIAAFVVMGFLAGAKRRAARAIDSTALAADAFQTTTCMWLSATALVGLAANATLGWWWADPVAGLALTWFVVAEGHEAWRGEESCGDDCDHE